MNYQTCDQTTFLKGKYREHAGQNFATLGSLLCQCKFYFTEAVRCEGKIFGFSLKGPKFLTLVNSFPSPGIANFGNIFRKFKVLRKKFGNLFWAFFY